MMSWFRWLVVKQQAKLTSFSPVVLFYNEVFLSRLCEIVLSSLCKEAKRCHEIDVGLPDRFSSCASVAQVLIRKCHSHYIITSVYVFIMLLVFEINEAQQSENPHSCWDYYKHVKALVSKPLNKALTKTKRWGVLSAFFYESYHLFTPLIHLQN